MAITTASKVKSVSSTAGTAASYPTLIAKSSVVGTRYVATKSDPLKMRSTTTTTNDNNVLARIPRGSAVSLMSYTAPNGWAAVKYNGTYGLVAKQYLSTTKPSTTTTTASSSTYAIAPNPTATSSTSTTSSTTTTNNSSSMASEKVKKVLKVAGIIAGVAVLGYGAYKFMQKKKMLPTQSETKALSGVGSYCKKCKPTTSRKRKSKKSRRGKGVLKLY